MKKKILFTVLIGIIVMFQGISFGAELTIYGSGGVVVNTQTGEVTICPNALPPTKCATLKIEGDEIKIFSGALQSSFPGQGVNGVLTSLDGQEYNVIVNQGDISVGSSGGYILSNFKVKIINP